MPLGGNSRIQSLLITIAQGQLPSAFFPACKLAFKRLFNRVATSWVKPALATSRKTSVTRFGSQKLVMLMQDIVHQILSEQGWGNPWEACPSMEKSSKDLSIANCHISPLLLLSSWVAFSPNSTSLRTKFFLSPPAQVRAQSPTHCDFWLGMSIENWKASDPVLELVPLFRHALPDAIAADMGKTLYTFASYARWNYLRSGICEPSKKLPAHMMSMRQ